VRVLDIGVSGQRGFRVETRYELFSKGVCNFCYIVVFVKAVIIWCSTFGAVPHIFVGIISLNIFE
jgi:hypothetical protein